MNETPESKILEELEKAAKHFNYIEFGRRDFDNIASISSSTVRKHYSGSWIKGLKALKSRLQQKGLNLSPRPYAPNRVISDKELFNEMERIWNKVGQRPSRTEWETSEPKISYNTYKQRFGGWTNACLNFIEYKMGREILADISPALKQEVKKSKERPINRNTRNIPLGIRLKVLSRDNFHCVFCGKSPVTNAGIQLQIDHIIPFSKGGKNVLDNLQTLCNECNLGKSNTELVAE